MIQIDAKTLAEAYRIASKILAMALACIVPILVGYYIDRMLKTSPVLLLAGTAAGLLAMVLQIKQLVRDVQKSNNRTR